VGGLELPLAFEDACLALRRRCKRWADDHLEVLRHSEPTLPASGNDPALDNWTPLLAIAETIGGDWPAAAVSSFHHITAVEDEDDAIRPMILEDIGRVFDERRVERLHSEDLVGHLVKLEERPWADWRHGKPITATGLSRLLKPFRIKSKQMKLSGTNRHGYELSDFRDAFDRYLPAPPADPYPPIQNATTLPPSNGTASSQIANATGRNLLRSCALPGDLHPPWERRLPAGNWARRQLAGDGARCR
jgi:hypothetical protein